MDFIKAPVAMMAPMGAWGSLTALALAVLSGMILGWFGRELYLRQPYRRRSPKRSKARWTPGVVVAPSAAEPVNQMRYVAAAGFRVTPLLNREEVGVLRLLEETILPLRSGHRVMAQTSLGEVIEPEPGNLSEAYRNGAFASINSKRLDFTVFDPRGTLVLAVEYQGSGHYHATSFMRDAVKREVLRKAGVPFLEIMHGYQRDDIAHQIRRALGVVAPEVRPEAGSNVSRIGG